MGQVYCQWCNTYKPEDKIKKIKQRRQDGTIRTVNKCVGCVEKIKKAVKYG